MGLVAALPDKARVIRRIGTGIRVHGEPQMDTARGPWFKCRLEDIGSTKTGGDTGVNAENSRPRYLKQPNIIISGKDLSRRPVDVQASDVLEVESREYGNGFWKLTGKPRAIRRKRRINHYEGAIAEVNEG